MTGSGLEWDEFTHEYKEWAQDLEPLGKNFLYGVLLRLRSLGYVVEELKKEVLKLHVLDYVVVESGHYKGVAYTIYVSTINCHIYSRVLRIKHEYFYLT